MEPKNSKELFRKVIALRPQMCYADQNRLFSFCTAFLECSDFWNRNFKLFPTQLKKRRIPETYIAKRRDLRQNQRRRRLMQEKKSNTTGEAYANPKYKDTVFRMLRILLPTPRLVVFYNGTDNQPDKTILRLSDSYQVPAKEPELELTITMLNINAGHNQKLMDRCQELCGYSMLVEKIRHYRKAKLPLSEAVEQSVQECLNEGILKEFLLENRKEVIQKSSSF